MIMSSAMSPQVAQSDSGPDGPPTNASVYLYGGLSVVGVQWTNGDPAAYTAIGYRADDDGILEPTSDSFLASPGVTSYETTGVERCHYWVRHLRGGVYTDWVLVQNSFGCGEEAGGIEI